MTSKIRFRGATSGFVELAAPDAAGSNTLVLPTGNGTSGQYLQTSGASGALSWATNPALFQSYAVICDSKSTGSDGGSFNNGAFRTRDLNTEITDPDGIVSIASNQFTLGAGNYLIVWSAPAVNVNRHQTRLRDVTNGNTIAPGGMEYCATTINTRSFGAARVSPTSNTAYEIQHYCQTSVATIGFGFGDSTSENMIYTLVQIFKEI